MLLGVTTDLYQHMLDVKKEKRRARVANTIKKIQEESKAFKFEGSTKIDQRNKVRANKLAEQERLKEENTSQKSRRLPV